MTVPEQMADDLPRPALVVRDDREPVLGLGAVVQQHDRRPVRGVRPGDAGGGRVLGDQDQTVHLHAQEGADVVGLALVRVVRVADQHQLAAFGGGPFHGVGEFGEEGLAGVRHDHADQVAPPPRHGLRDAVRPVPQLLDGGEHPGPGRGRHRPGPVVDHITHDRRRRPRRPRHVVPRHPCHAREPTHRHRRARPSFHRPDSASDAVRGAAMGAVSTSGRR